MTTLQKASVAAALVAALGVCMFQAHQNSKLSEQIQALQQEHRSETERLSRLEGEHGKAKQQLGEVRKGSQPSGRSVETPAKSPPKVVDAPTLPSAGLEDELDRACDETSPGKREAAMQHISKSILPSEIPRALAHLATKAGMSGVESPLFGQLASKWGESDAHSAIAWANSLSDASAQKTALVGVLNGWTHVSPEEAASCAAKLPAGDLQEAAVIKVINEWSFRDASGAASWVSRFPEGKLRDKAVEPIIFWGQGQCPAAIADMLDAIGNTELTRQHGEILGSIWLSRDAAAARAWILRSPLPEEIKQRLLSRANEEK